MEKPPPLVLHRTSPNPKRVRENVGLYRNLAPEEIVDVSEVNVTVTDRRHSRKANEIRIRSRTTKRASKRDEPLAWAINK